jgi:hypothetical protein
LTTAPWRGEQATALFADGSSLTVSLVIRHDSIADELEVAKRPAGAMADAPLPLSGPGDGARFNGDDGTGAASGLASNRAGDAVVAWSARGTVMVVSRDRDGALSRPVSVAPGSDAVAAMTPRGDAIVLFRTDRGEIRATVRPRGSARFRQPRTLTSPPSPVFETVLVGAALRATADGFVAAWTSCTAVAPATGRRYASCRRSQPSVARVSADGLTVSVRTFDVPWRTWDSSVDVLSGPRGDALALLSRTRGRGGVVRLSHAAPHSRFGPAQVISRRSRSALHAAAASGPGGGYVAWVERVADGSFRIVGADLSSRLAAGRPAELSSGLSKLTLPRVRIGMDGGAAVFWPLAGRGARPPLAWHLRARHGHGAFSAPVSLAAVDRLAVVVDRGGDVVALTSVRATPYPAPVLSPDCLRTHALRSTIWKSGAEPVSVLLDSSCRGFAPVLATSADGAILAAWERQDQAESGSLHTAVRPPGGAFTSLGEGLRVPLSAPPSFVAAALLEGDHAALVWSGFPGRDRDLLASFDDDVFG